MNELLLRQILDAVTDLRRRVERLETLEGGLATGTGGGAGGTFPRYETLTSGGSPITFGGQSITVSILR